MTILGVAIASAGDAIVGRATFKNSAAGTRGQPEAEADRNPDPFSVCSVYSVVNRSFHAR
jgi:hypothetical protein